MNIEWNILMRTGVSELDEQHKELIAVFNQLGESLKSGKSREEIKHTIDFLNEYAKRHFQLEEEHFEKYNCPGEKNKEAHQEFLKRFSDLIEEFNKKGNEFLLSLDIYRELSKWLFGHIMSLDSKLFDCIQKADN